MTRLIYACRFDVPSSSGCDAVIEEYGDWFAHRYRDKHCITNFKFNLAHICDANGLPEGHSLSSIVYEVDADKVFRIFWSFPDNDDAGIRWENHVSVGKFGESCNVEHLISIKSVEYNIAPIRLHLGSPRVVRDICSRTQTYIGGIRVQAIPYDLSHNNFGDFLELLSSVRRKLPLVLLSPYAQGDSNQIDADRLARNLAGVAIVVRIESREVTWRLTDEVGRHLSCFNGAARVYWPSFTKDDDPHGHWLFLGERIAQIGSAVVSRSIEKSIFAVAAFRFTPDQRIAGLVREAEARERQKLLHDKKMNDDFLAEYDRDLDHIEELRRRNQELEAENATLKANQRVFLTGLPDPDGFGEGSEKDDPVFSSVIDAVNNAVNECGNIEILDSAIKAASSSPFQRPFEIHRALCDLNKFVDVWRKHGGDLIQYLKSCGWRRCSTHISKTTKGKFRTDYEFEYKGKRKLFESHITIGAKDPNSCASIHFLFDAKREKVIIGHVGKHLRNTNT